MGIDADKIEIRLPAGEGFCHGRIDGRGQQLKLIQIMLGAKDKHATVPVIATFIQILLGGGGIGLLFKGLYRANDTFFHRLNITVAGFWVGRLHAEGDQLAGLGQFNGLIDGAAKKLMVANNMVCR